LVIAAIYFAFHFKSVLFSWASFTVNTEESTIKSVEPSPVNVGSQKDTESEMKVPMTVNDDDMSFTAEKNQTDFTSAKVELDEPKIGEKNAYLGKQYAPPLDTVSTQPTAGNSFSDVNASDDSQIMASKPGPSAPPVAEELPVNETITEDMDLNVEQPASNAFDGETEKELAEKEFKLLSRRLALRSKLTQLEQQVVDFQEVRFEPKIGRLILAEAAGDLQARKKIDPLQPLDKRLYLPEKERQAADIRTMRLAPGGDKVGDTIPMEDPNTPENTQLDQPVPKPLKLSPKAAQSADTSSTRPDISKELGISDAVLADDSKSSIEDTSEPAVADKPPAQAPAVKSELDRVAKPPQKSGPKVAALGNSIQNEDLDNRRRLKDRLQAFLEVYCHTYETKDLDQFATFFASNALENDKPFHDLLPKYRHNFNVIEFINYRIELQKFDYDNEFGTVDLEGRFFLEWLPGDSKWRRNSGKIFLRLQDLGSSFKISKLDYYGDRPKKSR
jgi:hypothetical protein